MMVIQLIVQTAAARDHHLLRFFQREVSKKMKICHKRDGDDVPRWSAEMKSRDALARSTIFTVVPDLDENIQSSNGLSPDLHNKPKDAIIRGGETGPPP
jgi:hypothetical protein